MAAAMSINGSPVAALAVVLAWCGLHAVQAGQSQVVGDFGINSAEERPPLAAGGTATNRPSIKAGYIRLSPSYTNALLQAILPSVAGFGDKIGAVLPKPLTVNHVAAFIPFNHISPDRREAGRQILSTGIGGRLLLTNGLYFEYDRGRVDYYASAAAQRQKTLHKPILVREISVTAKQAVEIVRQKIKELGYLPEEVGADLEPEIRKPQKVYGKIYGLYYLNWNKPNRDGLLNAEAWVNGETGVVEYLWLLGLPSLPPPALSVMPETTFDADMGRDLSESEKVSAFDRLLPDINWLARKLDLPVQLPITRSSVAGITGF